MLFPDLQAVLTANLGTARGPGTAATGSERKPGGPACLQGDAEDDSSVDPTYGFN